MSPRTGLAAEVPTLDLCRKMAAIPALAEAFKDSYVSWWHYPSAGPVLECRDANPVEFGRHVLAPLVQETLAWLDKPANGVILSVGNWEISCGNTTGSIHDPDALARACIEAAKGGG